ncbi:hypothetical protein V1477_005890 [Vespula maculifrons]|uniref:Uncharacterized protein n=1 Tax=Vespula maculifrons TaxID=7453 RepID=A0ABD2CLJ7_VESMC
MKQLTIDRCYKEFNQLISGLTNRCFIRNDLESVIFCTIFERVSEKKEREGETEVNETEPSTRQNLERDK